MLEQLREQQLQPGVILNETGTAVTTFGNDLQAYQAAYNQVIIWDNSNWGLLKLTGNDRARFLHNQTTNNINYIKSGQGCQTVFVNSTGRTLELATIYVTDEAILILVSPNRCQFLLEWMDKYLFPMDKVEITDISDENAIFTLIGPDSNNILKKWAINDVFEEHQNSHHLVSVDNNLIRVGVGNGLAIPGYNLIIPINQAAKIWTKLIELGAIPAGDNVWEKLRIKQGRPFPNNELTEDYNPLEAGLWSTISFDKGCYIGQETIARLNTYKGVKQRLWGVKLSQFVEPGTTVTLDDNKVGILTSCTEIEQEFWGLTYVKTKAGGAGLKVIIGEATGELIAVPFLSHEYYQPTAM